MNSVDLRIFIDDNLEMCDLAIKKERAYEVISDRLEKKVLAKAKKCQYFKYANFFVLEKRNGLLCIYYRKFVIFDLGSLGLLHVESNTKTEKRRLYSSQRQPEY